MNALNVCMFISMPENVTACMNALKCSCPCLEVLFIV